MGIGPLKRAVFLDRDGVLNHAILRQGKPHPPANLSELQVAEGAPEALARFKAAGFMLIVVTNQPDVGRGTQSREIVEEMNRALAKEMPIDEFVVCWHDGQQGCDCRKPKPGMVLDAALRHGIDLERSFLIGDRWRDVDCAHAAGVQAVWIDRAYEERGPERSPEYRCASITEAAEWILSRD